MVKRIRIWQDEDGDYAECLRWDPDRPSDMVQLHPQILKKDGQEQFVILPWQEYVALCETLEDLQDLCDLQQAKLEDTDEPSISHEELGRQLGLLPEGDPERSGAAS